MADDAVTQTYPAGATAVDDADNEALLDASKTFKITAIGAVLFCLAALYIIMSTRMG